MCVVVVDGGHIRYLFGTFDFDRCHELHHFYRFKDNSIKIR